ncbi:FAD-dependent oxidoreductase [Peptoniphilus sp. KCTC 25270]|uniref:NAD(P)/FAD-dependent oxidoreductase n=1 Tax=Peptoniphilus sp. KCTC 25270 TaxID=2897414 RepID=UPI001E53F6FF|nr:NAD(P)-binding protein [Peptoniphilus sp. KCTC 25270]MCD1146657.1 FAD-dependent oxidoreductase [Peptoniphilus sp. KCTC 25270]
MLRIRNIRRKPSESMEIYEKEIGKILRLGKEDFTWELHQESLDARKKHDVHYMGQLNVWPKKEISKKFIEKKKNIDFAKEVHYEFLKSEKEIRPIIVGSGPCGLFAAYVLAKSGLKPILLERGEKVEDRIHSVENFWDTGTLNPKSNVQFGEGGAGTFSDGKLTSRSKDPKGKLVLDTFVEMGAPKEILYMKKPHIGTDRLRKVLISFRKELLAMGAEIHFQEQVLLIEKREEKYQVKTEKGEYESEALVLALGHSARDTFEMLFEKKLAMESKPFAVGFRIEQNQEAVNLQQYGEIFKDQLPPAEYALTYQAGDFGCYTFCMCPGGYVVAAASEEGRLVVNGMSYYKRDGNNANAAILATVDEKIFGKGALAGMEFQREMEEKAFVLGGSNYKAPAQRVGDYLAKKRSQGEGKVLPTYEPGVSYTDLNGLYPEVVNQAIHKALMGMEKKMKGFAGEDSLLTGVETRSSSPVRLIRDKETLESISHENIYPAGEGAGYAGGIVSSAIDGIRVAEKIIEKWR